MSPLNKEPASRKKKLKKELNRIVSKLQDLEIEKIILFGSLASGNIDFTSDIDLIIIKKTTQRFLKRLEAVYEYTKPRCAIDILVYTPEEFSKLLEESGFVKNAVKNGQTLYEKK